MKNLATAFFSLLSLSFASNSIAQVENPWTVGGLLGETSFYIDASNDLKPSGGGRETVYNVEKASSYSLVFLASYAVTHNFLVEYQLMTSLGADKIFRQADVLSIPSDPYSPITKAGANVKVSTMATGAYAVYRIGGDAYAKFRLGLGMTMAKYSSTGGSKSLSDFGLTYGVSVGHTLGPGAIEFMYMRYPDVKAGSSVEQKLGTAESVIQLKSKQHLGFFSVGYTYSF